MFNMFFPEFFYKVQMPEHEVLQREYLNLAQQTKLIVPEKWDCNLLVSKDVLNNNSFTSIIDKVTLVVKDMLSTMGKTELIQITFPSNAIWINVYNKGHYQEYHTHASRLNNFSFVYFVKYNKVTDGKFTFWNDKFELLSGTGISDVLDLIALSNTQEGRMDNIEEGDIIIFPSHLKHKVTKHQGNNPRITVAGNILITSKDV